MSTSCGAKPASIRNVVRELAERPVRNVDRQTDGRLFSFIYIEDTTCIVYSTCMLCIPNSLDHFVS